MASPPITVGELSDVPAPLSPVNAQFHQEVANRITHRFASVAQMNAWAAGNGSIAYVAPTLYLRQGGAWVPLAPQSAVDAANTARANADATLQTNINNVANSAQGQINALNAALATYPQGMLARSYAGFVDLSPSTQVVCSVTWTADPSRWYRLVGDVVRINSGTAPQDVVFVIEDNAGTDYRLSMHRFSDPAQQMSPLHLHLVISGLSGGQTWRLAGNTSTGNAQIPSGINNASNAMLTVEDMGAV
jgi:hypothetical protein